jgi:hypothetical protein
MQDLASMYTSHLHGTVRGNRVARRTRQIQLNKRESLMNDLYTDEHSFYGTSKEKNLGALTDFAITRLMRETKVRAPHKPLGCDKVEILYRGMSVKPWHFQAFLKQGYIDTASFSSFSHSYDVAVDFVDDGGNGYNGYTSVPVIMMLKTKDVQAGTPWLWFWGTCGDNKRNRNRVPTFHSDEREVLLPPGKFRIHKHETTRDVRLYTPLKILHVSFEPDIHAVSIARLPGSPSRHRQSIFPRAQRTRRRSGNNGGVEGYVPLHSIFDNTTDRYYSGGGTAVRGNSGSTARGNSKTFAARIAALFRR